MHLAQQRGVDPILAPSAGDMFRLNAISETAAGIVLGEDKGDFVLTRLSRRLTHLGVGSFHEYCNLLESSGGQAELQAFLEALTTHTTSFFREKKHYDWLLSTGFEELTRTGAGVYRDLVIWSAACSTGQELYSAMIAAQQVRIDGLGKLRFAGVGTDLSASVVRTARNAVYREPDIAGIPKEYRATTLLSSRSGDGRCRIVPGLRDRVEFRTANLTKAKTLTEVTADVVFLRNVLIYFDERTQSAVISHVLSRLRPGGILLTGHSETAHVRNKGLHVIAPTIYRKE